MTFRLAQKVACFMPGDAFFAPRGEAVPVHNGIYTIRAIRHFPFGIVGFHFYEIRNEAKLYSDGQYEAFFNARHFRPVVERKTDISVFTKMQTPSLEVV